MEEESLLLFGTMRVLGYGSSRAEVFHRMYQLAARIRADGVLQLHSILSLTATCNSSLRRKL